MKAKVRFFICKHCGNVVEFIRDKGTQLVCCGDPMKELIPNTTDAATEKHVPVATLEGDKLTVKVGSVAHPMLPEHYIEWIAVITDKSLQRFYLDPGEKPEAVFTIADAEGAEVYEYCNIHGLWKTSL